MGLFRLVYGQCQVYGEANNFDIYEIVKIIESSFYVIIDDASENLYRKEIIAYAFNLLSA